MLRLARRHAEPGYFDVGDPGLDAAADPYRAAAAVTGRPARREDPAA
jgi:hypothetical protein